MSGISDELKADLTTWFSDRPAWLQIAAARLLNGEEVTDDRIKEFARLALDEALEDLKTEIPPLDLAALGAADAVAVRLKSISAVQGIGNLSPRRPLSFGDAPITVVYGSNGAGKSSYVRILKHACGARNKGNLHPDVFNGVAVPQGCKIGYFEGGTDKEVDWTPIPSCQLATNRIVLELVAQLRANCRQGNELCGIREVSAVEYLLPRQELRRFDERGFDHIRVLPVFLERQVQHILAFASDGWARGNEALVAGEQRERRQEVGESNHSKRRVFLQPRVTCIPVFTEIEIVGCEGGC